MYPHPRSYIDWTVPTDKNGKEIGVCADDDGYRYYLEWLADYLFMTLIPVPEPQAKLLEEYRERGADYAVLDLSDLLGYSCLDTAFLEEMAASGKPFSEYHALEMADWNELSIDEKEDYTEEVVFTSEEDYMRLGEEYKAAQLVPAHIRHADIPYRPILAALFKDIFDARKRYELLDFFYRNFDECASK